MLAGICTVKEVVGDVNIPIVCGGQIVKPGDAIIADDDGVVVVERHEAADILTKSAQREEKEARMKRMRTGSGQDGVGGNSIDGINEGVNNLRLQRVRAGFACSQASSATCGLPMLLLL